MASDVETEAGGPGPGLSSFDIGLAGVVYVAGACLGALFFGQLTDKFGRKKLFLITLDVYTCATVLTAFSMNPMWYVGARFLPVPASAGRMPRSTPGSARSSPWASSSCGGTCPRAPGGWGAHEQRQRLR